MSGAEIRAWELDRAIVDDLVLVDDASTGATTSVAAVPALAAPIAYGEYDVVLGSPILAQNAVARGMPRYKYVANRMLTTTENLLMHQKLSEYHTGLRAYSRELLTALPLDRNSDDFVFDNQILAQALTAVARIGELSCPTRYHAEPSSIGPARSARYGLGVLCTAVKYRLQLTYRRRSLEVTPLHAARPCQFGSASTSDAF
jgi:hypothetical protein